MFGVFSLVCGILSSFTIADELEVIRLVPIIIRIFFVYSVAVLLFCAGGVGLLTKICQESSTFRYTLAITYLILLIIATFVTVVALILAYEND